MIDSLDVRVPKQSLLTGEIEVILAHPHPRFQKTWYYRRVADLRPWGFSSILHYESRRSGNHKLELLRVGKMSLSSMLTEIASVVEVDPQALQIMRVDLTADVLGYTVDWFRENMRAAHKRCTKEIQENDQKTFYLGKRPDLFRVYDKSALRRIEYQGLLSDRRVCRPLPPFEEMYGHSIDDVVTRVEHQYGGRGLPKEIDTVGSLLANATTFNPFKALQIRPGTCASERIADEYEGIKFFKAQTVLRLKEKYGLTGARRIISEKTAGNASRFFKGLEALIAAMSQPEDLDLFAEYRRSTAEQLAGEGKWTN